jgi:hypothetical protein
VPLTITANDQTKLYGAALPALTASYSGFINGDTAANLATQPTLSTTATASSHVSGTPYSIAARGAADSDYSISYVAGRLTVTPAPLMIAAMDELMIVGTRLPALSVSYYGFVDGDSPASLSRPALLSVNASPDSLPGLYTIAVSGAASPDYAIALQDGVLTVLPPSGSITRGQIGFVTTLYQEVLRRTPQPAELEFWTDELAARTTPRAVALSIWNSIEHRMLRSQQTPPQIPFLKAYHDALKAWKQAARREPALPHRPLTLLGKRASTQRHRGNTT